MKNPFLHTLVSAWAILGGVIVLIIVGVTMVNVSAFGLDRVARLFGANVGGLPGYEDFVRLAISCAALMFFPYCQAKRGHIVVDLLTANFPVRVQRALDVISLALTCTLALFLGYWMIVGMVETYNDNALSRVLGWPEWPFYGPGIVSLFLWAMVAGGQVFEPDSDADV